MKPYTYNVDEHIATCKLTIDHKALCENWRILNAASPRARTAGVVKANGYGLGLGEVGLSLAAAGCEVFFVATPDEGMRLRRHLKTREIFVLSGLSHRNAPAYAESNLIPVLNRLEEIEIWSNFWKLRGSRRPCALQLDTGMNRAGMSENDIKKLAGNDKLRNSVNIITVISHLACGDEPTNQMNKQQLDRFIAYSKTFKGSEFSLANSAGINLGSDYHFDLVRAGIALYGGEFCDNLAGSNNVGDMHVVVTADAKIAQIRQVKKGEVIGYGGSHKFSKDSIVALVGVGYADGFLRSGSGSGVNIRTDSTKGSQGAMGSLCGYLVPVIGRISMDSTAFDISEVPQQIIENAIDIELFGKNIKLDDTGRAAGSNGYEVLTSIGQRYWRNHINQPEHAPGNA